MPEVNRLKRVKCFRIKSFNGCTEISAANRFLLSYKWQVLNTLETWEVERREK